MNNVQTYLIPFETNRPELAGLLQQLIETYVGAINQDYEFGVAATIAAIDAVGACAQSLAPNPEIGQNLN